MRQGYCFVCFLLKISITFLTKDKKDRDSDRKVEGKEAEGDGAREEDKESGGEIMRSGCYNQLILLDTYVFCH